MTPTTEEREALRASAAEFVRREVMPHLDDWEREGALPRALHLAAAKQGLLGVSFPESVGGEGGDFLAQFFFALGGLVGVEGYLSVGQCRLGKPQVAGQVVAW